MQEFWEVASNDKFSPNWHIEYFCNEMQKVAERVASGLPKLYDLIINVPPGTTKTLTCSIMFPVWCWIRWPWFRFIATSYSSTLSLESAEYSRDLVRSDKFKRIFKGLAIKADKDTKSNFRVTYTDSSGIVHLGGNRYSTSVGGTVTGFHGHILLIDDPLNPHQAVSDSERATANEFVDQTLSTRKVNKAVTTTILIQQRLHPMDSSGHLLAKKGKRIKHICLPGEINTPEFREKLSPPELASKYIDGLLDPIRLSQDVLSEMKADLGQQGYMAQVGQDPRQIGSGLFKIENFHTITELPPEASIGRRVRYWDKAGTQGAGAFTAGVLMYELKNVKKWIVADLKHGQWATDERERIIKKTTEADGQNVVVVVEQEPGSGGKDSAHSTITNLAGFAVFADRPTGDKVYRADPYSVQVNEGNVQLLYGPWIKEFKDEHESFPGLTKDIVDAAAGAFNYLRGKRRAGPVL